MSSLIRRDLLDVVVKGRVITSIRKVLLSKVGKTLTIEVILKMLKSKSVVEDDSVVEARGTLLNDRSGRGKASGQ
jgi:hypothetical protein